MAGLTDEKIVGTVVEALPVGVWVARAPGGEFVYANSTFMEIMGMAAREDVAVGDYAEPYKIFTPDAEPYPEDQLPFVRALTQRETVMVDDLVIHRSDGGRVSLRAYARPIFDEDVITHIVIAFFDISREVEAERARAESEARMRRAQRMESIGNLAGGIAHDFNNLLGAIKAIASSLALDETDPKRLEDLRTIDTATDSAGRLTRSLLGFAGRGKNLDQPVSLNDVIRGVLGILGRALDRRYTIETTLQATRAVTGDPTQLEQVVMNLVLNARDAMPRGGRIILRTRDLDDQVILEIEDEGGGVPDEIRDRIFEPYFTTKNHSSHRSAGLGLATAYGIVEVHGGALDLTDGRAGACFRASFPARAAAAKHSVEPTQPQLVLGSGVILVVEDETAVRIAIIRSLERAGYDVVPADDGLAGVETFEARSDIDAVVLDLTMPRLGGRGAYERMRAHDPAVRVLLTTGYALNEEAQQLLDLGVRGFIEKPFDAVALSAAVAKVLAD